MSCANLDQSLQYISRNKIDPVDKSTCSFFVETYQLQVGACILQYACFLEFLNMYCKMKLVITLVTTNIRDIILTGLHTPNDRYIGQTEELTAGTVAPS